MSQGVSMTRVKGASRRRGVPTTRQRIRVPRLRREWQSLRLRAWLAGSLAGALARASLPGPARFLADGKNRTALLSAQGLPPLCQARLPVSAVQVAQDAQRCR